MSNFTLSGWQSSTATLLVAQLPLQTFDEALLLVDSYLSSVGGWNPADATDSTGLGEPANAATPEQAVVTIVSGQLDKMYRLTATVTLTVGVEYFANLVANQSDADVIAQMTPSITSFIQSQLGNTNLEYSSISSITGTVTSNGTIDATQRVAIQTSITGSTFNDDPRAIALNFARNAYTLGTEWNVAFYYSETDTPIVVVIKKYTDTQYDTLESSETNQYVVTINQDNYNIASGSVIPISV